LTIDIEELATKVVVFTFKSKLYPHLSCIFKRSTIIKLDFTVKKLFFLAIITSLNFKI